VSGATDPERVHADRTPLVSVIVPVLNGERHLAACIASILRQSYRNFELIIADNASSDGTAEIIQRFDDPRIRVLTRPREQLSLHVNWSRAVREGTGEFVKIVCHDDVLFEECLEAQVALFQRFPTAALAACRRRIIDDEDRVVIRSRGLGKLMRRGATRLIAGPTLASACTRSGTNLLGEPASTLIRRSALPEPLFDSRWNYALDIEFYMRCVGERFAALDRRTLCAFRVGPHQLSARLGSRQASEMRAFFKQMLNNFPASVTPADVRIGTIRSQLIVQARRTLYLGMRIRRSRSAWRH
jgi:glycosyltransferase involved in cell wall biosynthesis